MNKKHVLVSMLMVLIIAFAMICNVSAGNVNKSNVDEIQNAIDAGGFNWTAGETSVSGLTIEEKKRMCGALTGDVPDDIPSMVYPYDIDDSYATAAYVGAFDWRSFGGEDWMTPVKDQGYCGSCWAFSALGVTEAVANIHADNASLDMDLSEQHLVSDCCVVAGDCDGGWNYRAFNEIRDNGIPNEACNPYLGRDSTCNPCHSVCNISSYAGVSRSQNVMKYALQEYGPVSFTVYIRNDFWYYTGGVYEPTPGSPGLGYHAMVLTGWNDSEGCWIVKNSWGNWGESGYVRIKYGVIADDCIRAYVANMEDNVINFGGWTTPVNATASSYADKRGVPTNAIDNKYKTCWTQDKIGKGKVVVHPCWIQFDLGDVMSVSNTRTMISRKCVPMTFDIQVSTDEENWSTVVSNATITTSGTFVEIPFDRVDARYIRLNETAFPKLGNCAEFDAYVYPLE